MHEEHSRLCTSKFLPREVYVGSVATNASSHCFMTLCRSLRWPHFGCRRSPDEVQQERYMTNCKRRGSCFPSNLYINQLQSKFSDWRMQHLVIQNAYNQCYHQYITKNILYNPKITDYILTIFINGSIIIIACSNKWSTRSAAKIGSTMILEMRKKNHVTTTLFTDENFDKMK